ncbi:hypothetical protein CEXT_807901 [Caerostris extrusa]|uniref:Peptidase M12B propeptide domain-containing protein n=1 Tax=Caerostris extrusa TaxID=172846 RepID=A0AAV4YDV0_CAEEX|nr:hypothetical protein CEXT_807901 [Caerostris extrusa]
MNPAEGLLSATFHVLTVTEGASNSSLEFNRAPFLWNCIYEGFVENEKGSAVTMSVCNGLAQKCKCTLPYLYLPTFTLPEIVLILWKSIEMILFIENCRWVTNKHIRVKLMKMTVRLMTIPLHFYGVEIDSCVFAYGYMETCRV